MKAVMDILSNSKARLEKEIDNSYEQIAYLQKELEEALKRQDQSKLALHEVREAIDQLRYNESSASDA